MKHLKHVSSKHVRRQTNWSLLAFAIPTVCMLTVMAIGGYSPFGDYSMLYSDMFHQYYPFFVAFRKALLGGHGLIYTWSVGMGMDYLGLIAYYLASPLNLLGILVPKGALLGLFSLFVPIKLGLAGLFFSVFLRKAFRKNDISIAIFGSFYAMCAWALGYQWNLMWLDTFALLPLVVLGAVELLRDRKFVLYTVTLFLSVFTNYYIGLFTCVFVFLFFFGYELCRWRGFKRFFTDLLSIGFFSLLAIGMTAALELPALAALQDTYSAVNKFPTGFQLNIAGENTWKGFFDAVRQTLGNSGAWAPLNFKEGLPNIYCGAGSVVLAFLCLTTRKVKLREKFFGVALLFFFISSFIIRQLDYIWHGFHFTNMIPYRFSFLYSFVLLCMAYRAYLLRHELSPWQVALSGILGGAVIFAGDGRGDPVYLSCNLAFLLLYTGILLWDTLPEKLRVRASAAGESAQALSEDDALDPDISGEFDLPDIEVEADLAARRELRQKRASVALACVFCIELIVNILNFGVNFPPTAASNYPKGTVDTYEAVSYMEELESGNPFYRAEVTHAQTLNDGALIGYNGVSTFTSSVNVSVTRFMQSLGYAARDNYNRYCFEESSPVANLFLGLKYMIERDGQVKDNAYFKCLRSFGQVSLLENNAYLPLGFLTRPALEEADLTDTDPFVLQNTMLSAASGVSGNFWRNIPTFDLEIKGTEGVELTASPQSRYCSYKGGAGGTVSYFYTANNEGLLCVHLNLSARNSFRVYKNDQLIFSESITLPQMFSVCMAEPGDVFELRMDCRANETGSMTIKAAILDGELFGEAYEALSASPLELTRFDSTYVEGNISSVTGGLLYTSIPDDGNWRAFVDGKPAKITDVGGCMVAVELDAGDHTVTFRYSNTALTLGLKISLTCAMLFLAALLIRARPVRRMGRHEKGRGKITGKNAGAYKEEKND